ncbi:hypothetical protein [Nocardia wallacei]|uniref:hypothetical protein n=1 Tax=Nocardia wallacei TaxID=480035 RepID=UPI00245748B9|nr:hypothetical protein [Nocardia wallacei]
MPDIAKLYGKVFISAFNKEIDFNSDTIKVMATTSLYVPDQDLHQYKSDVTNEVSGTGYTAGGLTLTGCTVSYDGPTNTFKMDSDDYSWGPGASFTARNLIYYDATPGSDAARPLLAYVNFATDMAVTSSTFNATINSGGIATVTIS